MKKAFVVKKFVRNQSPDWKKNVIRKNVAVPRNEYHKI